MKLSIILLVSNSDFDRYQNTLEQVQSKVKCDYELIVVNNSDYYIENSICYNKNLGILEGRIEGYKKATGDFIWFIDNDDDLGEVKVTKTFEKQLNNCDYCQFAHNNNQVLNSKTDVIALWNKWIKKDVLLPLLNIPKDCFVIAGESLVFYAILEDKIELLNKQNIYNYNFKFSKELNKKSNLFYDNNVLKALQSVSNNYQRYYNNYIYNKKFIESI